jgi:hypothetical protein
MLKHGISINGDRALSTRLLPRVSVKAECVTCMHMTGIISNAAMHVFQHIRFIAYNFEQESPITVLMSRCPHSGLAYPHGSRN